MALESCDSVPQVVTRLQEVIAYHQTVSYTEPCRLADAGIKVGESLGGHGQDLFKSLDFTRRHETPSFGFVQGAFVGSDKQILNIRLSVLRPVRSGDLWRLPCSKYSAGPPFAANVRCRQEGKGYAQIPPAGIRDSKEPYAEAHHAIKPVARWQPMRYSVGNGMANHSIRGSMMGPEEKHKKVPRGERLRTIYPAPVALRFSAYATALKSIQGELAVELFRILRRVHAWAETSEDSRAGLFELDQRQVKEGLGRACGRVPRLVEAFGTFAQLVRAPADVAPATVAGACVEVMDWAAEQGKLELAVLFAEAAATADPLDAGRANSAGRTCRWAARMERAASWYQRAFGLAVRAKNRQGVIDALLGYGNVRLDQGRHSEAKVYFERAARRAATTGRLRQAGKAHHDLLSIAAEVGTLKEGYRHVVAALNYYPAGDVRLPGLAHDWGFHLVRLRLYAAAVPVLQLATPRAPTADEEAIFLATLAWAFAGSRRREPFETTAARCVELLETCRQYAAGAYLHLAAGAMAFGLWERAEEYLKAAKKAARKRKQEALASEADELLKLARKCELAPPEAATVPLEGGMEALARVFRRLRTRIGAADAPARGRTGADASSEIARRVRGGV